MASACDTCAKPGSCCSGFPLPNARGETIDEVRTWLRTVRSAMSGKTPVQMPSTAESTPERRVYIGVPFEPLFRRRDGTWMLWCPNLTREGRCGDYENRPPTCIGFDAGFGGICVHHVPKIGLCTERAVAPKPNLPYDSVFDVDREIVRQATNKIMDENRRKSPLQLREESPDDQCKAKAA